MEQQEELGGGLALTGGAYVGPEGGITSTNRWLRFDFNDPNHRSLIILGGTSFTIGENIVSIEETTSYNLSDFISEEGTDYYVFINADGRVVANTIRTPADGYMFIGQFHTLCNGVAANTTAICPMETGFPVGDELIIMDYDKNTDLDFYNFYKKTVDAINNGTPYSVVTVLHPLQGFNTGDILPESVCCLNFHPKCKNWDGMVYCNTLEKFVDIYLQSGTGRNTKSEFGAVHTVSRQWLNQQCDMQTVGKSLLTLSEFMEAAMGSNERTAISGGGDRSTVGGHVDTANRRMISFIGCEECCGYLEHWLCNGNIVSRDTSTIDDGRGVFGLSSEMFQRATAGGYYAIGGYSGMRSFAGGVWYGTYQYIGARGITDISIV